MHAEPSERAARWGRWLREMIARGWERCRSYVDAGGPSEAAAGNAADVVRRRPNVQELGYVGAGCYVIAGSGLAD